VPIDPSIIFCDPPNILANCAELVIVLEQPPIMDALVIIGEQVVAFKQAPLQES